MTYDIGCYNTKSNIVDNWLLWYVHMTHDARTYSRIHLMIKSVIWQKCLKEKIGSAGRNEIKQNEIIIKLNGEQNENLMICIIVQSCIEHLSKNQFKIYNVVKLNGYLPGNSFSLNAKRSAPTINKINSISTHFKSGLLGGLNEYCRKNGQALWSWRIIYLFNLFFFWTDCLI